MKKSTAVVACLLVAAGLYWFTEAGDLEPPGPPAPTMRTLDEICGGPQYVLVGFSASTFNGARGLFTYAQACQADFPGSRMCSSREIM